MSEKTVQVLLMELYGDREYMQGMRKAETHGKAISPPRRVAELSLYYNIIFFFYFFVVLKLYSMHTYRVLSVSLAIGAEVDRIVNEALAYLRFVSEFWLQKEPLYARRYSYWLKERSDVAYHPDGQFVSGYITRLTKRIDDGQSALLATRFFDIYIIIIIIYCYRTF